MNDYAGTSHEAIYAMVKAGRPSQVDGYATDLNGIRNQLGGQVAGLREQLARIPAVWSDVSGSERLTTDLGAVSDYLDVLAVGLSGQPSSYADLLAQAAADLAAAQPPAVLPPPPAPGQDVDSLQSDQHMSLQAIAMNPAAGPLLALSVDSAYGTKIAAAEAAQQLAGQTATTLDNNYRTLLARMTPPPEPPAAVSDAGATSPVAPGAGDGSAAASGGWPGAEGGPAAGGTGVTGGAATVGGATVPADWSSAVGAGAGPGGAGSSEFGSTGTVADPTAAGLASVGPGVGGSWFTDGQGGVGGSAGAGLDAAADPALTSGLRTNPAAVSGAVWDGSGSVLGSPSAHELTAPVVPAHPGLLGERGFDAVSGAPVTTGADFGPGHGSGGSSWETVAGAGGLAVLAAGGLYLARGGLGGATTGGGVTGGAGSGGAAGSGNAGAAGVRGLPGAGGSNSMVQGGQIGQAGRPTPGSAGYGSSRPAAPGSVIGGAGENRVTWLVEDRDLYGIGPSVAAVIEVPVEPG